MALVSRASRACCITLNANANPHERCNGAECSPCLRSPLEPHLRMRPYPKPCPSRTFSAVRSMWRRLHLLPTPVAYTQPTLTPAKSTPVAARRQPSGGGSSCSKPLLAYLSPIKSPVPAKSAPAARCAAGHLAALRAAPTAPPTAAAAHCAPPALSAFPHTLAQGSMPQVGYPCYPQLCSNFFEHRALTGETNCRLSSSQCTQDLMAE